MFNEKMMLMRILYINHDNNLNGSTIALKNILQNISRRHEVRVVTPRTYDIENSELIKFLNKFNIHYYTLNYGLTIYSQCKNNPIRWFVETCSMLKNTLISRYKIQKIVDEFKPDIVHTNNGPVNIAFDCCRKKNIPHVWHLREYSDVGLGIKVFPSKKQWLKNIHSRTNYNIAITQGVYDYYKLRKCDTVIYDGVINLSEELPSNDIKREKYFLFVADASQEGKGFYDVLLAFKRIQKEFQDYKILVAGPFYKTSKYGMKILSYIEKENLSQQIEFLGFRKDVYHLMNNATALLVTSYFGGFGFTTTEAMFCDCLVIGRNTTGTKEQFDNGMLFTGLEIGLRFETIEDLVNCMRKSIVEDMSYIRKRAKQVVKDLYSTTMSHEKLEKYYYHILDQQLNK